MNKAKLLLIPSLLGMLLVGCNKDEFGEEFENVDVTCTGDSCIHVHDIKWTNNKTPKTSYYVPVGGTKKFTVSVSDKNKIKDNHPDELKFTWTTSNKNVASINVTSDTMSCTVSGLKEGEATFKVSNNYIDSYSISLTIKVIKLEEGDYIWQEVDDPAAARSAFGRSDDASAGEKTGTAKLKEKSWQFTRSEAYSIYWDQPDALQLGKGPVTNRIDDQYNPIYEGPEDILLQSTETKPIKKVIVDAASANGVCQLTCSVGETNSDPQYVSYVKKGDCSKIEFDFSDSPLTGNLKLFFDNPYVSFDNPTITGENALKIAAKNDPQNPNYDENFRAPGAIHLKSIIIMYGEN